MAYSLIVLVAFWGAEAARPTVALASCESSHQNVEGWDSASTHYGNGSQIYINDEGTITSLRDTIARSVLVVGSSGNDVEVGWTANNDFESQPTTYAEWVNRGVDSGPQFDVDVDLMPNTDSWFSVDNVGHVSIFQFHVDYDGSASLFNYSPTMNFQNGAVVTNSEHYNTCDSMWTHMYDLAYYNSAGDWVTGYDDLGLFACNTGGNWLLNVLSNSELYVDQDGGVCT